MPIVSPHSRPPTALWVGLLLAALIAPGSATQAGAVTGAPALATASLTDADRTVSPEPTGPIEPTVTSYPVPGVSQIGRAALALSASAGQPYAALSAPLPASGFAVTGATWTGRTPAGLRLAVRTRTDGSWSGWTRMVYDKEHGPSSTSDEGDDDTPGTDPFVVGDVDDVQLRAFSDTGVAPNGLRISIVDPGTEATATPASSTELSASATEAPAAEPKAAASLSGETPTTATPQPRIRSRAEWGADEGLRDCCIEYGEVHAGFVHHTVNSNGYSRAEVPAILRGIYAYHTQSRGWRDVGYNYLIDRFGRIWEGRAGGIDRPVVGAHTLDYNENSFAASAIGNFDEVGPSAAMLDAYARLYAWKLSLHGVRPRGTQSVAGTMFDAISGHRDAAQTACPGQYLYAQVPAIIDGAAGYQRPFTGRGLYHSFVGDDRPDVLFAARRGGQVAAARGTGRPGFERRIIGREFSGRQHLVGARDVTGDGINDLMARTASTGSTAIYPGAGDGTFGGAVRPTLRWADTNLFSAPGDLDGDGLVDVVARDSATGSLLFYPGNGAGAFGRGRVAIEAFRGFRSLAPAGDFDADGHEDVLGHGRNGSLWVLFGDGAGRFPTKLRLADDWSDKDLISGGSDLTGDARPDVVARNANTLAVRIFANVEGSALSAPIARLRTPLASLDLSRDVSGDRRPDLVGMTPGGRLVLVPARRQNWLSSMRQRTTSWPGTNKVMVVGDWDGDGEVDAMSRQQSTGLMWLYPGNGRGGFGARVGGWENWGGRSLVTPVGDFDGDGYADLMARAPDGHIYLYPGRARNGFGRRVIMRSDLPDGATISSVGRWDGDGAPDVVVRTVEGTMLLYPGNGPGGLDEPKVIGLGFDRYTAVIGIGDLTGNGRPDLMGQTPNGQAWLIPGLSAGQRRPDGGFGKQRYVAADWPGYLFG
ncbi:MAG: VCBS repeat-containing protein [Nocardioidaceae bacterium]|nr:VCBS repeat-containing protein [Nocardioidaceae bacterium]